MTELSGIELREAVASRVMGLEVAGRGRWSERFEAYILAGSGDDLLRPEDKDGEHYPLPAYESDIAAAWLVVEKMRKRGHTFLLNDNGHSSPAWFAEFGCSETIYEVGGDTAPLAICRAALAALEAK